MINKSSKPCTKYERMPHYFATGAGYVRRITACCRWAYSQPHRRGRRDFEEIPYDTFSFNGYSVALIDNVKMAMQVITTQFDDKCQALPHLYTASSHRDFHWRRTPRARMNDKNILPAHQCIFMKSATIIHEPWCIDLVWSDDYRPDTNDDDNRRISQLGRRFAIAAISWAIRYRRQSKCRPECHRHASRWDYQTRLSIWAASSFIASACDAVAIPAAIHFYHMTKFERAEGVGLRSYRIMKSAYFDWMRRWPRTFLPLSRIISYWRDGAIRRAAA